MGKLVAQFPGVDFAACLHYAVFGLAEAVKAALDKQVERERQASEPISENAVVDIAAGGEVTGQRRGLLPRLAATAGVLVVTVRERLAADEEKTLG